MYGVAALGGGSSFAVNDLLVDLHQMGRAAQPAPPSWFPGVSENPGIVINGSPIAGACTKYGNAILGMHQMGGAYSIRLGVVPLKQRTAVPIETHYLVYPSASWAPNAAPIEVFGARTMQKIRGIFQRKRVALSWAGGPFASHLWANGELHDVLWKHLLLDDGVDIRPQPAARLVRIVHRRVRIVDSTLFKVNPSDLRSVEPPLFWAFEWIASMIHAWAAPPVS